jgi:hypothetical protein
LRIPISKPISVTKHAHSTRFTKFIQGITNNNGKKILRKYYLMIKASRSRRKEVVGERRTGKGGSYLFEVLGS